jgi:predicted amidohydrolase
MDNSKFKLAMGQMLVEGGEAKANLDRATKMIENAADKGCSVIVLPECMDLGWANPAARDLAQPIPGSSSDILCQAARESKIHVVAGLTERADGRIYDTALLISPGGEILVKHRKINILTDVEGMYSIGDHLAVATTPLSTIGVDICADNFPDSLSLGHALARMGAQILLSPCWQVLAEGPYGETAECLMTVPIEPLQRRARGTEIARMLKTKGYEGP